MTGFILGSITGFVLATLIYLCLLIIFGRMMRNKIRRKIKDLKMELDKNPSLFNENLKSQIKKYIKDAEDTATLSSKRESIQSRLLEAQEITRQQLELRAHAEMPSKNAAHSRYKNGLISEIEKLEEEKIAILQSILDDGYDPVVSTVNEHGESNQVKLSDFINRSMLDTSDEDNQNSNEDPTSEDDLTQPKKVGKFFLIRGGKDDGGGN